MSASYNAVSTAHFLAANLKQRLAAIGSTLAVTESFGSANDPLVQVGTLGAGTQTALIRLTMPSFNLAPNAVGNTQTVYSPMVVQVLLPDGATAGQPVLTYANMVAFVFPLVALGSRVEVYAVANATTLDETGITAANKKATFDSSLMYGLQASI